MANKRISDLPAKNTPDTADLVPIIDTQNGVGNYTSKKTTVGGLLSGVSAAAAAEITAQKGQVNGLATLGNDGKVPSTQLPVAVDDVVAVNNFAALPSIGETGKIYLTLDTSKIYLWNSTAYVLGGAVEGPYIASTGSSIIPAAGGDHFAENHSSVSGGVSNTASGYYSFVGGGFQNTANNNSVVVGGSQNVASGQFSFIGNGGQSLDSMAFSAPNSAGDGGAVVNGYNNSAGFLGFVGSGNNNSAAQRAVVCGGLSNTASGDYSAIGGGRYNTAIAVYSAVSGGNGNTASGDYSTVSGGRYNIANGSYGFVGGGRYNTASGYYSTVSGGYSNTTIGDFGFVSGGNNNIVSGNYSAATGGRSNTASGDYSTVGGGFASADRHGMHAYAAGFFSVPGDAQRVNFVLRNSGADTDLKLYLDGVSKKLTIPAGKALFATATIAGIGDGAGGAAHYVRKVAIKNVGGNTSLIGTVTTLGTDIGFSNGGVSITADNVNDALQIAVSAGGDPARWVAHVDGIEIAYAVQ